MAFYDYKCSTCGNKIEVRHSIKATPTIICEICGCVMLKLISKNTSLEFVGNGFYETDYKKKPAT